MARPQGLSDGAVAAAEHRMSAGRQRINRAAEVSDVVVAAWNEASNALRTLWVNGAGVISDRSMVHSDLATAAAAIKRAQEAMKFSDWPRDEDYDE